MTIEQLLNSKDFKIDLGRMIERLKQTTDNQGSWLDVNDDEISYTLDDGNQVSIELVPLWANLENIDCSEAVDLYNDYQNTSYTPEQFKNLGSEPYKEMDIKIRLLDWDSGLDETIDTYYFV